MTSPDGPLPEPTLEGRLAAMEASINVMEESLDNILGAVDQAEVVRHLHTTEPAEPTFNAEIEKNSRGTNYKIVVMGARSTDELRRLAHEAFAALTAADAPPAPERAGQVDPF